MITTVERWRDRAARLAGRYQVWEERRGRRFAGWSVRRRWTVLVLVPTLVLCCGGTAIGAPLAWFVGATVEAGRGAPSPDAAADDYLMALSYDNQDGLPSVLDDEHQGELLKQWQTYRAAMKGTDPPPARLDFGALAVGPVVAGRVEVSTDVSATWWGSGSVAGGYRSKAFTWRFTTREANGWQVSAVEAPVWCGGYVLASKCS